MVYDFAARVSAAGILLDAAGAARHSPTPARTAKDIRITIRKMVKSGDED
jgi:hypothetical protein